MPCACAVRPFELTWVKKRRNGGKILTTMRSRSRLPAALACLCAMFFAQAAFALAACNPMQAQSRAHMIAQQADTAPCHQPADNANLCLTHCQAGEQTLDKHQVKVPDASAEPVLVVRAAPPAPDVARALPRAPLPATGPPTRILYRTLRI
jgi:hypothetical protein